MGEGRTRESGLRRKGRDKRTWVWEKSGTWGGRSECVKRTRRLAEATRMLWDVDRLRAKRAGATK